jgi:hypothetical protein
LFKYLNIAGLLTSQTRSASDTPDAIKSNCLS